MLVKGAPGRQDNVKSHSASSVNSCCACGSLCEKLRVIVGMELLRPTTTINTIIPSSSLGPVCLLRCKNVFVCSPPYNDRSFQINCILINTTITIPAQTLINATEMYVCSYSIVVCMVYVYSACGLISIVWSWRSAQQLRYAFFLLDILYWYNMIDVRPYYYSAHVPTYTINSVDISMI